MRTRLTALTICLLGLSIFSLQATRLVKDPLAGKWEITVTPDDDARREKQREFKDKLTFKGVKFVSEYFEKKGFDPGIYEDDVRQGGIGGFSCEQKSKDQGKLKWTGFVTTDQLKGDLVWTDKDGTVLNFAYQGSK